MTDDPTETQMTQTPLAAPPDGPDDDTTTGDDTTTAEEDEETGEEAEEDGADLDEDGDLLDEDDLGEDEDTDGEDDPEDDGLGEDGDDADVEDEDDPEEEIDDEEEIGDEEDLDDEEGDDPLDDDLTDPDDPDAGDRATSLGVSGGDALSRLAHATDTDPATRSDASGRDVTPPPAAQPAGQNPGLATEADPEQMDFREFDSGAPWTDDRPAPDRLEADTRPGTAEGRGLPVGDDPDEEDSLPPASADLIEAVTTALEEAELLDLYDLSVELAGDTVILRGSAATREDRDRAAELASALPGVGRVQNLISAG